MVDNLIVVWPEFLSKVGLGSSYIKGDNVKVIWPEFSTLS
jgi:hypothetical protein